MLEPASHRWRGLTLRYGFCLPHHRPYATRELILETARRGEAVGYDTIWLGGHIVPPLEETFRRVYFEPLVLPHGPR